MSSLNCVITHLYSNNMLIGAKTLPFIESKNIKQTTTRGIFFVCHVVEKDIKSRDNFRYFTVSSVVVNFQCIKI